MAENKSTNWLKSLLGGERPTKKSKSYQWIILFFLLGVAIMLISSFLDVTNSVVPYEGDIHEQDTATFINKEPKTLTTQDYEKFYENQLTEILTEMLGVSEVVVKVTLDSTEELVVGKNTSYSEQNTKERDNQGGTRDVTDLNKDEETVIYNSDDDDKPLVIKTIKPKVRGVVVVAEGAENIKIKAMITDAVQRLLDVPPYKIGVYPKK